MRIALYGYGKMGRTIEQLALAQGHQVAMRVDSTTAGAPPTGADVAIEFSEPAQALANMHLCLSHGLPIVVGTTGWYDRMNEVKAMVQDHGGSLLWASNFSIGVNLLFRLNRQLALLMERHADYAAHIDEIHHVHKKDAPSGTAITLARDIDLRVKRYEGWELGGQKTEQPRAASPSPLPIFSERVGEVPGKHSVSWVGTDDRITLTHEAFGRQGFASGALLAAEWIIGRKGLFTMDDLLDAS